MGNFMSGRGAGSILSPLVGVCAFFLLTSGCHKNAKIPAQEPKPSPEALRLIAEGDLNFKEGHLYGWRRAEAAYQKGYALTGGERLKEKLLLTRFLILTRQIEEEIPDPNTDAYIQELCSGQDELYSFCEIATWYRKNKTTAPPKAPDRASFSDDADNSLYNYFRVLLAGNDAQESANAKALAVQFGELPLFKYLYFRGSRIGDPAEIEKAHPEFAEAFEIIGEYLFQKKQYRGARLYFQKALQLIPEYTRSTNGIGNICFFALEDYDQALRWYEESLKRDPTNVAAQFGKGAALHRLARYQESNTVLDKMLSEGFLNEGRLDDAGYRYYSGESYYLKAYNNHLMRTPEQTRELVDKARQFLPDSEEINNFSGELYFEAAEMESAKRDFLKVLSKGNSNCTAQMHLGLIYQWMGREGRSDNFEEGQAGASKRYRETWSMKDESAEKKALNYFLGASSCMQSAITSLKDQIQSVPTLDLEPSEKVLLSGRLQKKMLDASLASASNIQRMIRKASEYSTTGNKTYIDLMSEVLKQIQD